MAMTSVQYVKSRSAFAKTVEIKGLYLQLKRSMTEHTVQKINFSTSTSANGCPLPLWHVSYYSEELLMSYYLYISSSYQHVQHITSHILLILIDFDSFFDHFSIGNYNSLNFYSSGTRRDIKKW